MMNDEYGAEGNGDSMNWRHWLVAGLIVPAIGLAVWSGMRGRVGPPKPLPPTPAPFQADPYAAQRQLCAAQLAKIGQALAAYAEDNDGAYPVSPTATDGATMLRPILLQQGLAESLMHCPAQPERSYLYHSYRRLGPGPWPKWMAQKHLVTRQSPGDTWLLADYLPRDLPGPHSATEKAFNVLCVDGRVRYHEGRPRDSYR